MENEVDYTIVHKDLFQSGNADNYEINATKGFVHQAINCLIKESKADTNLISDGYHTFGELYEHRIQLFIALCWTQRQLSTCQEDDNPAWRSLKHFKDDDPMFDDSFIMGIKTIYGDDIRYHLPISKWEECDFAKTLDKAPEWDGHTSADVLERLKNL